MLLSDCPHPWAIYFTLCDIVRFIFLEKFAHFVVFVCVQVAYSWSISRSELNHAMMRLKGNEQFSIEWKALIFTELKAGENTPPYGQLPRVKQRLQEKHHNTVTLKRLWKIREAHRLDGWQFPVGKRRAGAGPPLKYTEAAIEKMVTKATGSNARAVAKKQYFREVLTLRLKPSIPSYNRSVVKLQHFYHDHVTNSTELYDEDEMNAAVGTGKWIQFAPKLCRVPDGRMWIDETDKRKGHWRKQTKPNPNCRCAATDNGKQVPSSSPDLNLAEYAQGMLRKMLNDAIRDGSEVWRGSVKKKMQVIMRLVNQLNGNKAFFKKLWAGHPARLQKCLATDGGLT